MSLLQKQQNTQQEAPLIDQHIRQLRKLAFNRFGRRFNEPHRFALAWLFPLIDEIDNDRWDTDDVIEALLPYSSYLKDDRHGKLWDEMSHEAKCQAVRRELARVARLRRGHRSNKAEGQDVDAIILHVLRVRPQLNTPRKIFRVTGLPEQTLGRALRRLETRGFVQARGPRGRRGQTWSLTKHVPAVVELRHSTRYLRARSSFRSWLLHHPLEREHLHLQDTIKQRPMHPQDVVRQQDFGVHASKEGANKLRRELLRRKTTSKLFSWQRNLGVSRPSRIGIPCIRPSRQTTSKSLKREERRMTENLEDSQRQQLLSYLRSLPGVVKVTLLDSVALLTILDERGDRMIKFTDLNDLPPPPEGEIT